MLKMQGVRRMKKQSETKQNFKFAVKLFKEADKNAFVVNLLISFLEYPIKFFAVYFSAQITAFIAMGEEPQRIIKSAVLLAVSVFVCTVLRRALQLESEKRIQLLQGYENKVLSAVVTGKDYTTLEKPDFQESLKRYQTIMQNNGGATWQIFTGLTSVITGVFGLAFSILLLAPSLKGLFSFENTSFLTSWKFAVLILFCVVLSAVATALISDRHSKKMIALEDFYRGVFAEFVYWFDFPVQYKSGKDIRIYNSGNTVLQNFKDFEKKSMEHNKQYTKLQPYLYAMAAFQVIITALVMGFVAVKAWGGMLAADDLVRFVGSVPMLTAAIGQMGMIPFIINWGLANIGYLRKVYEYPDEMYKGTLPTEKRDDNQYDIEFKNVSFKYPGSEEYALRNVSLKLKIGEHLAFVGHNGSGKNTFIKLLCRLYDPTEGEILLNGIDIKKYNMTEYMALFGVVFQDFSLFSVPLSQNVTTSMEFDRERLRLCLDRAGIAARVQELKYKEDTVLYKDFDDEGVEISGGEAQKLAIARALYRDAPFVVLDEPTAALDPVSEFEIYSRFNSFTDGKTAVYISHRLSSCRFCDKIVVFDKGQIVQTGSHETLLADENGQYNALWNAQAKYYIAG